MIRFNLILPIFRSPCRVLLWFMVLPCNSSLDSSIQMDNNDMHSKRTQEDVELYWTWKAFDPVVDFPWIMSLVTGEWWREDTNLNSPSLSHQYENQLEHLHHSRWAEVEARRTVEREKAEGAVEGRRRPQSPLCRSSQCQGHSSGHHIGVGRLDEALVTVSE